MPKLLIQESMRKELPIQRQRLWRYRKNDTREFNDRRSDLVIF